MQTVLKIENLSKQYRLGEIGTGTISHDLKRWWAQVRGKEDPFSLVGQVNDRTQKASSDFVWALKDINFEVQQGEVLGIIGKNGAGKSTLLKLISRITSPTTGAIKVKGRIASLLEVGTGMHPEMTARENIYLNGAIMGMKKSEITKKFDEIVDFAGCAMYVDTPVKRYSSGMRVRLGFAVAAFLEPEILIVDEVLAVGDAEFQKKAIGKMKDVSSSEGRTVLFVSHNMASIKALCGRGIVMKNGMVGFDGNIIEAVTYYQNINFVQSTQENKWTLENAPGNSRIKLLSVEVLPLKGDILEISSGIKLIYKIRNEVEGLTFGTVTELQTQDSVLVFSDGQLLTQGHSSKKGNYTIEIEIPPYLLNSNIYFINLSFWQDNKMVVNFEQVTQFEIENSIVNGIAFQQPGIIRPQLKTNIHFEQ